jgi:hypothetical protein
VGQCEKEHNSPVSVFEIQHEEYDETSDSSFSQCLDNVESEYRFPSLQSKQVLFLDFFRLRSSETYVM